eukprot:CAMPEP_0172888146 /NCGR_PEP_ID=MMETSP1075-20121228/135696_1 /TAXON_ID=2916 /ORGANISM="Ceratium fusus, Strain PA161109" /LENGTH=44 /DNA_ID= /DNA_START= /DNA_END= /DNA_ORIENTATION=
MRLKLPPNRAVAAAASSGSGNIDSNNGAGNGVCSGDNDGRKVPS